MSRVIMLYPNRRVTVIVKWAELNKASLLNKLKICWALLTNQLTELCATGINHFGVRLDDNEVKNEQITTIYH